MTQWILFLLVLRLCESSEVENRKAKLELPKFTQLQLLYPGYPNAGGKVSHHHLFAIIGIPVIHTDTSGLRLSVAFNRFSGQHTLGEDPIELIGPGPDSLRGNDGLQYIRRNGAWGPYLAAKYGEPLIRKFQLPKSRPFHSHRHRHRETGLNSNDVMKDFRGLQGVMRIVSAHHNRLRETAHVGLWDCDHLFQSKDWPHKERHIVAVELWKAPDSFCPPPGAHPPPRPHLQAVQSHLHVIARHNLDKRGRADAERAWGDAPYDHRQSKREVLWIQ